MTLALMLALPGACHRHWRARLRRAADYTARHAYVAVRAVGRAAVPRPGRHDTRPDLAAVVATWWARDRAAC